MRAADAMKRAWTIRKEAANKWEVRVGEISMSECLIIAWAEIKEGKMKEGYYKVSQKDETRINELRAEADALIKRAEVVASKLTEAGKPAAAARICQFIVPLKDQIAKDETSVAGGDPTAWIVLAAYALNQAKVQVERFDR